MIVGMFVSVAVAVLGALVALGYVGHPIDAQLVTTYGWSILIVGCALFALFAAGYARARRRQVRGRSV